MSSPTPILTRKYVLPQGSHPPTPLVLAPPPPRQACDPRLELDLGGGLGRTNLFMQGLELWLEGGCRQALPSPSPPAHGATSLGRVGGNWRMEEEDTGGGLVRALITPSPPCRRRRFFSPAPAAGGGGRRRGRRPLPWGLGGLAGRERVEGGQLVRQERRGVDKGRDGRLPFPPVLRKGHPEPAINDRGCLERVVGKVR
jgi:hypothetical protein